MHSSIVCTLLPSCEFYINGDLIVAMHLFEGDIQMEDSDKKYIVLAYMAIMQDPEAKSAEQFIKDARIHALQNWWGTPETGIHKRGSILHDSQRLLEISEIKEVYTQTKQLSLQEVPPALETSKVSSNRLRLFKAQ
jgi:hypothetical protein